MNPRYRKTRTTSLAGRPLEPLGYHSRKKIFIFVCLLFMTLRAPSVFESLFGVSDCGGFGGERGMCIATQSTDFAISRLLVRSAINSAAVYDAPRPLGVRIPLRGFGLWRFWRRERDSNPRFLAKRRFSRPVP